MRIRLFHAIAVTAGLVLSACATHPPVPPPSTDIDETLFRGHVRMLASDGFEGRKPGTPGEERTLTYLVDQFKKLGLKPGNDAGASMTTANEAIALAQKDIVTAFARRKAAAK